MNKKIPLDLETRCLDIPHEPPQRPLVRVLAVLARGLDQVLRPRIDERLHLGPAVLAHAQLFGEVLQPLRDDLFDLSFLFRSERGLGLGLLRPAGQRRQEEQEDRYPSHGTTA